MTEEHVQRGWPAAAGFVLAYVVLITAIVVFSRITLGMWDGPKQMLHFAFRVMGGLAVARGLFLGRKWAYWIGMIFGLLISFSGAIVLLMGLPSGLLEGRPYPIVDVLLILATTAVSALAALTLLTPAAREKLNAPPPA